MDSSDKYWVLFYTIVAATIVVLTLMVQIYTYKTNSLVIEELKIKGANGYKYVKVFECGKPSQYKWLSPDKLK